MNLYQIIKKRPLLSLSVIGGVGAGVLCCLYFLGVYWAGYVPLGSKKEINIAFNVLGMGVGVWYYKTYIKNGWLHFWEGISICYLINFMAALLSATFMYLFLTYGGTDLMAKYYQENRQLVELTKSDIIEKMGQATYQQLLQELDKVSPSSVFWDELIKKTIMGIIPALLVSMFFRSTPQTR